MRHPRPQGATYLATEYRKTNQDKDREALYRHLVTNYTTQGFRWNGVPTSIPELSFILKIPQTEIMGFVSSTGTSMGSLASTQNIKNTLQTIMTLSTTFALQDRGLIMQQLNTLLTSQGGKYKAFVTGEVNKALKLALESNKNISEIYKTFFTNQSNTTNILNIFGNQDQNEDQQDYLTPDEAIRILNEKDKQNKSLPQNNPNQLPHNTSSSSLADTSNIAETLHNEYGIGDLQDVRERRSGTSALQALEPKSPEAQLSSKAVKEEDGGYKRRGIEVVDIDELPDQE